MSKLIELEEEKLDVEDQYLEHEYHIIGEGGRMVPYFRNAKVCSTCYSKWKQIVSRARGNSMGRDYDNITANPEY